MTFGGVPVGAALLIEAIAQDGAGGGVRNDLLSERPLVPQLVDKSTCTSRRSQTMRPMKHATASKHSIRRFRRPFHYGARIWQHDNAREPGARRELAMYPTQGVKQACGYHRHSVAETAISRVKTIFSDRMCLRSIAGQGAQMLIRCAALNRMTHSGEPDSYTASSTHPLQRSRFKKIYTTRPTKR